MLKYFIPSILWILAVLTYNSMAVGLDNFFALLPHEVLISMTAIALPIVVNWVMYWKITKSAEPESETLAEALKKLDPNNKSLKNVPVEGIVDGVNNLVAGKN